MKKIAVFATIATFGTLAACAHQQPRERSYGNDALPSAEVIAFQKADARLKYADARIGRDANGCALYEGRATDGTTKSEALFDEQRNRICAR